MNSIVILISGRGSNMQAILEAELPLNIAAVISNRTDAPGLAIAQAHGIPTQVIPHQKGRTREAFDATLIQTIDVFKPDWVVLAGFMRILTPQFVAHYAYRLINIHPSLLPAFPGLDTHQRALEAGVKIHGCTIHFVTNDLDAGPIIAQAAVPVWPDDTQETLAARVLQQEHRLYPHVLRWLAENRLELCDNGTVYLRDIKSAPSTLFSPEVL